MKLMDLVLVFVIDLIHNMLFSPLSSQLKLFKIAPCYCVLLEQ